MVVTVAILFGLAALGIAFTWNWDYTDEPGPKGEDAKQNADEARKRLIAAQLAEEQRLANESKQAAVLTASLVGSFAVQAEWANSAIVIGAQLGETTETSLALAWFQRYSQSLAPLGSGFGGDPKNAARALGGEPCPGGR
jgi:hypothetical protein